MFCKCFRISGTYGFKAGTAGNHGGKLQLTSLEQLLYLTPFSVGIKILTKSGEIKHKSFCSRKPVPPQARALTTGLQRPDWVVSSI
jgi:hypothetical protein